MYTSPGSLGLESDELASAVLQQLLTFHLQYEAAWMFYVLAVHIYNSFDLCLSVYLFLIWKVW